MGIQEIESLSSAEKILLVEQIWDSIDKDVMSLTSAQKKELDRRLEKHEKGQVKYSSWEQVKQRLNKAS
jgi:putative addiction module component (TIGR02574 family)